MGGHGFASEFDFTQVVRPHSHIIWPQGTGEPLGLTARLMDQAEQIVPATIVVGMITSATLDHPAAARFDYLCLNGAGGARRAVAWSRGRVIPAHISIIPGAIEAGIIPVNVALIRVRPTRDPNVFSLGVMVDFVHEMIDAADVVIAEVDERMPVTSGDVFVSRDRIDHLVMADGKEHLIGNTVPGDLDRAIGSHVANLIPDRATVQFGVGGLPVAISASLASHKDLGIHSGVIPDAVVDLIESGVVTNRYKGIDEGVTVTGGLFGSRRLLDFANEHDAILMRRATYTHAASTMLQLNSLYTVNSAIAVDLGGQVNAEVASNRYLGAVGGQVDYVRGARLSNGGRSIIALASTTADGAASKIILNLGDQPVTTPRSDVDIVVTEYGVAELWARDLPSRAKALIAIAHPDFREQLEREAFGKLS